MTSDLHQRAKELFVGASGLPAESRVAFVDAHCGADEALKAEVMSLLGFHDSAASEPAPTWARTPWEGADSVGAYRLLEKLGEGGMGVVYEAEQTHPVRRRVAVKLIKWGMDTQEVLARFESERQALALMDHPAIARVYEAGATEQGRPFFAMELAKGAPITEYCDARSLTIRERLRLFLEVCLGVQHAHQKGVIHRDLKPSNVLVTDQGGAPRPKIIDFGISRATAQRDAEETVFTRLGQWVGTPEYMSPEQAEPGSVDIDTRTDVYSLGVVLYELLAGSLPFDTEALRGSGLDEMRRHIRDVDPPRPSTRMVGQSKEARRAADCRQIDPRALARALRGDLDWIVMKALEKDRSRRYGSPAELAADIERHLAYEPVLAGPPSTTYRLGKLIRRHRLGFSAAAVVVVALLLGIVGTTVGLRRAEREAKAAMRATEALVGVFLVMDPRRSSGDAGSVSNVLQRGAEQIDEELSDQPQLQARVLSALGQVHYGLGHYSQAQTQLQRALDLQRRFPPRRSDEVLTTLYTLGWVRALSGDLVGARRTFNEGLHEAGQTASDEGRAEINFHVALAWAEWQLGDQDAAQDNADRAVELCEKALPPTDPAMSDALAMAASLQRDRRDFEASRLGLERCLAIREQALGSGNAAVGLALLDLGASYQGLGRREEARRYLERSLEVLQKALGSDHPWVAGPLHQLGDLSLREGNLEDARRYLEHALRLREQGLGPDHRDVAWTLTRLADLLRRQGEHEESRRLLERAERILAATLPPDHPEITAVRLRLVRSTLETGRLSEARARLTRVEELVLRPESKRRPSHAVDLYNLACLRALHGDQRRALELLRESVTEGFVDAVILDDPDLTNLESTPELAALRAEVRTRLAAPAPTSER